MAVKKDPRTLEVAEPFVSLFPVQPEVLELVKDSMRERGFQADKPILAWKDAFGEKGRLVVVDGHTRLRAALDLKLEVSVTARTFKGGVDEAITAGVEEQVIRRNLNREQIAAYVISILPLLDETKGGLRKRTAKQLAAMLGVSVPTVDRARGVIASGDEFLIAEVKSGELSLLAAYNSTTGRYAPPPPPPPPTPEEIRAAVEESRAEAEKLRAQGCILGDGAHNARVLMEGMNPEAAANIAEFRRLDQQLVDSEDRMIEQGLGMAAGLVEVADDIANETASPGSPQTPEERLKEIHEVLGLIDRLLERLHRITLDVTVNAAEHRGAFRIAQVQFHASGAIYALNKAKKKIDLRDVTKVVKVPAGEGPDAG